MKATELTKEAKDLLLRLNKGNTLMVTGRDETGDVLVELGYATVTLGKIGGNYKHFYNITENGRAALDRDKK